MKRPDCDCVPSKLDVFKRGCASMSDFMLFFYLPENGTVSKLYRDKVFWACRAHVADLHVQLVPLGLMLRARGDKVKLGVIDIVKLEGWQNADKEKLIELAHAWLIKRVTAISKPRVE